MSFQDPATHARARQQTGFRYEAARRQLAQSIHDHTGWHGPAHDRGTVAPDVAARQTLAAEAVPLYDTLVRYVRRTLDDTVDRGETGTHDIAEEDVVLATYLAAIEAAASAPSRAGVYPWLRRIARREISDAVARAADRDLTEQSLDARVAVGDDEGWPEEILHLVDILAAPDALISDSAFAHEQTRHTLDRLLIRLPERWREIFLLSAVDGWPDPEIARVEGVQPGDVRPIVDASRAFLREWLRSAAEVGAI